MKGFKSHFVFSRNQQNGIFLLLCIIFVLQAFWWLFDFEEERESSVENEVVKKFQLQLDSLKTAKEEADTLRVFPFNPNYLTDYRGYVLGLTPAEIDRLQAYRAENKWVNSPEDFQKVTGVSDSLLEVIAPYFRFPEWVSNSNSPVKDKETEVATTGPARDLNTATAEELQEVSGIGEVLSARIVNYRTKIKGFIDELQLKDIYGLDYKTREKLTTQFTVKTPPENEILNINEASLLELSEVPYFDYELAREIVDYRLLYEGIESFEELSKIENFPADRINRIQLYLSID